jgi:TonB-linked SusC/RagA family outer membrane protein
MGAFGVCISMLAQDSAKIRGRVVDLISKVSVIEANISVQGMEGVSTVSSDKGYFELTVPSPYSALLISYPGYQTKTVPLFGNNEVMIELIPEGIDGKEAIVNLPYYTLNERDLNGAYTVIAPGGNKTVRSRDINQLIQGTVPGLEVNSFSGIPGEGANYILRGFHSLYRTNIPLLVVDGVPVYNQLFEGSVVRGNLYNFLSDVNVKDIESVTVLRDAAAAGIYGSRAANGAIVITTKEGTTGKSFLDVSIQQGVSSAYKDLPVMNASEYLPYLSEKLYSQGLSPGHIAQMPVFSAVEKNTVEYWKYANNTNWLDEVTRNAYYQDYYLNLRGGDATSKYSLSAGYNDMKGVVKGVSSNRLSARFNLDFRISPKLSAGLRISFVRSNKDLMDQGYEERVNPLYLSLIKPPVLSPYQKSAEGKDGPFFSQPDYDGLSNPLAVVSGVSNEILNTWLLGKVFTQYDFSKTLNTRISLSLDRRSMEEDRFTPANGIVPDFNDARYDRVSEEQFFKDQLMGLEHTLTFNKQLNPDFRLRAFGGYSLEFSNYISEYGRTIHATSDDFQGLGDGQKDAMNGKDEVYRNISLFANTESVFREKMLLKAGIRIDGSSKFGNESNAGLKIGGAPFAVLPYLGAVYRMKSESFLKSISFLDELNLKASWGLTANQDIPLNARYSLYQADYYTRRPGIVPYSTGNPSVKWESIRNYNIGLDLSFFDKWLGLEINWFNSKTTDLLLPVSEEINNKNIYLWTNGGSLSSKGFEFSVNTLGRGGDFVWNASLNLSGYISKVSDLPYGLPVIDGEYGFSSISQNNNEAVLLYGYKALGVFRDDKETAGLLNDRGIQYKGGDFHFEDINKDGIINELDRQVIGNPNPDFFGGITAGIAYKRFGLDVLFSYSYGNEILNVLRMKLENGAGYENQSVAVLNRWQADGDIVSIPNTRYGDPAGNRLPSSHYVEDGSYFKLKTLTLSYNVDERISFVRNMQVYLTAYNLFTVSNYLGWDPEVSVGHSVFMRGYDFGNYPQPKMFMIGLKIGL